MTDRRSMDLPATVLAAAIGVALVAASLPFALQALPEAIAAKGFDVAWSEADAGRATAVVQDGTPLATVSVEATGLISSIELAPGFCEDSATPPVQQLATIHYKLTTPGLSPATREGTYSCNDTSSASISFNVTAHPDIARRDGASTDAAESSLWSEAGKLNTTTTYTLELSFQRASGTPTPLPIPIPGVDPTLSAELSVIVHKWSAVVTPTTESEVLR